MKRIPREREKNSNRNCSKEVCARSRAATDNDERVNSYIIANGGKNNHDTLLMCQRNCRINMTHPHTLHVHITGESGKVLSTPSVEICSKKMYFLNVNLILIPYSILSFISSPNDNQPKINRFTKPYAHSHSRNVRVHKVGEKYFSYL